MIETCNKHQERYLSKEAVAKLCGFKPSKSAEEVLEHIRSRKVMIVKNVQETKEFYDKSSWFKKLKNKKKYRDFLFKAEASIAELSYLEDYITNFYSRIANTEFADKFLDK